MKSKEKKLAVEHETVKLPVDGNEINNIDVVAVANYLFELMQPDSEASKLLDIGKVDKATWLKNSTNGVVVCEKKDSNMVFINLASNVSTVIPLSMISADLEVLISTLTFILYMNANMKQTLSDEVNTTQERKSKSVNSNSASGEKSMLKLKREINEMFSAEKETILEQMSSANSPRQQRQILFGQLMSICFRCGYQGGKSKNLLFEMLDDANRKEFKDMYDMAA